METEKNSGKWYLLGKKKSTVDAAVLHKNGPIMSQGWMEEELRSPCPTDELLASERLRENGNCL